MGRAVVAVWEISFFKAVRHSLARGNITVCDSPQRLRRGRCRRRAHDDGQGFGGGNDDDDDASLVSRLRRPATREVRRVDDNGASTLPLSPRPAFAGGARSIATFPFLSRPSRRQSRQSYSSRNPEWRGGLTTRTRTKTTVPPLPSRPGLPLSVAVDGRDAVGVIVVVVRVPRHPEGRDWLPASGGQWRPSNCPFRSAPSAGLKVQEADRPQRQWGSWGGREGTGGRRREREEGM